MGFECGFVVVIGVVVMWLRLVLVTVVFWLCFWRLRLLWVRLLVLVVVLLWFLLVGLRLYLLVVGCDGFGCGVILVGCLV